MKSLTSIEIHFMLKEIGFLAGSKIDKIYHQEEKEILLQLHVPNLGKKILKMTDKAIYLAQVKEEGVVPTGFCMQLRKYLDNSRLKAINQIKSERIVEFIFETKEGDKRLIAEFFGGGNIILCFDDYKIIGALEFHTFKDREIKKDAIYKSPEKGINFFKLESDSLMDFFKTIERDTLVKALAVDVGIGGIYAEEICLLAHADKNKKPKDLAKGEIESVVGSIEKLLSQKLEPQMIFENGKIKDAVPLMLEIHKEYEKKSYETFSEALELFASSTVVKKTANEKSIDKIKKIIDKQRQQIVDLTKDEAENREKAEAIYNNYILINEILAEIRKATEKFSWVEIKNKLEGHKVIKEVNTKDKQIIIEL